MIVWRVVADSCKRAQSFNIIPERAEITSLNNKYIAYGKVTIARHGRKSPYYTHVEGAIKQTWSNNVTVNLIFNEFLHNEYKRSFIEYHLKLCAMLDDVYIGPIFPMVTCPLHMGEYHLMNLTWPSVTNFPYKWPFQRARVDIELVANSVNERMASAELYLKFMEK